MAKDDVTLSFLGRDIISHILSFFCETRDICSVACCSKFLSEIAGLDEVWRTVALRQWPSELTEITEGQYGSHREMVLDDNKKQAGYIWTNILPENWKFNQAFRFYRCFVEGFHWNRRTDTFFVLFHAVGETDLRRPDESSIYRVVFLGGETRGRRDQNILPQSCTVLQEITGIRYKEYKGYMEFNIDDNNYTSADHYVLFNYACSNFAGYGDYCGTNLVEKVQAGQTLRQWFAKNGTLCLNGKPVVDFQSRVQQQALQEDKLQDINIPQETRNRWLGISSW